MKYKYIFGMCFALLHMNSNTAASEAPATTEIKRAHELSKIDVTQGTVLSPSDAHLLKEYSPFLVLSDKLNKILTPAERKLLGDRNTCAYFKGAVNVSPENIRSYAPKAFLGIKALYQKLKTNLTTEEMALFASPMACIYFPVAAEL